jgi:hypothetical protein
MESAIFNTAELGPKNEGEYYLDLLEIGHLANQTIPSYGIPAKDFLDVCGEHARPMLVGLNSLDRDDPRFEKTRNALQGYIQQFLEPLAP